MADGDLAHLFLIQNMEEIEELVNDNVNGPRQRFHRRDDAFEVLSDQEFIKIFRLNKELTRHLINIVAPHMRQQTRISALSVTTKVLIALRFYGGGSYQVDVGSNINFAVSQPSVSRCIQELTEALNNEDIFNQIVQFPRTFEELAEIRLGFYRQYHIPGIIGAIDCTHVAIIAPPLNDENYPEYVYINRKRYHSLNVQLICDHNMRILNVNSRFPGSSHDSYIWQMSNVRNVIENIYRTNHRGYYLIGDQGYPLRPWLLTPLEQPEPNTPEFRFNTAFKRARSTIERCNGLLKSRFRCLLKHRVLHYSPTTAAKIVNACTILHNLCIEYGIPEVELEEDEVDYGMFDVPYNEVYVPGVRVNPDLAEARMLRNRIINNHFA
ncbi:hypothetical protein NQ315_008241 [Exocentrus adspersus]|uniref:DDE Tnp4 domain-containing protein n=1 Tax=Exocentrus adspersus TaxID=1586481 RepID=A0AAV8VMI1_9CUCU|nr:hypothetical protein NQ315_013572 [Exocentrus adspersus]KAJ8915354.1 hypothetical protein NQ315_008241 [Exocentrus adspersus]